MTKHRYMREMKAALLYLKRYFKNPVHQVQSVPFWSWPVTITILLLAALISALISGVIAESPWVMITGLIATPIATLATVFVCSTFLYYTIIVFKNEELGFKSLFILTTLANLPLLLFQTLSSYIPPINLVGFAFTCILLAVGLVENFSLQKKFVLKLLFLLYVGFVLIWALGRIEVERATVDWKSVTDQHRDSKVKSVC